MSALDNHKPGCACPRCQGKARTAEREQAEREQAQTRRDTAWFAVMGQGGPDAVIALAVQHGGLDRAGALLEAGGFDAAAIISRWRAKAPHGLPLPVARHLNDPEAVEALRTSGIWAQRARARELAEEDTTARPATLARHDEAGRVLWSDRAGNPVFESQAARPMAQRSTVNASVPELGSEK